MGSYKYMQTNTQVYKTLKRKNRWVASEEQVTELPSGLHTYIFEHILRHVPPPTKKSVRSAFWFLDFFYIYLLNVCGWVHACYCAHMELEDNWQKSLLSCGFWGSNSGHQTWQQRAFATCLHWMSHLTAPFLFLSEAKILKLTSVMISTPEHVISSQDKDVLDITVYCPVGDELSSVWFCSLVEAFFPGWTCFILSNLASSCQSQPVPS